MKNSLFVLALAVLLAAAMVATEARAQRASSYDVVLVAVDGAHARVEEGEKARALRIEPTGERVFSRPLGYAFGEARARGDVLFLEPARTRRSDPAGSPVEAVREWMARHEGLLQDWVADTESKEAFRMLFSGPSGTGKTMGAALLGTYGDRDVYRIDLSMAVNKYIGETEKNLSALFARTESLRWVLFFDEADALFGRRTDVEDAHDRYANQEVSFLLQRVETARGLVVLAL